MKYFKLSGFVIAFIIICNTANAQINSAKTALFPRVSQKTACTLAMLDNLFSTKVNSTVTLYISEELTINGEVIEKVKKTPELESINIRCFNFKNALFNISRINQGGTTRYVGTIVSPQHNDVLTLTFENGQYFFKKDQMALVMVD